MEIVKHITKQNLELDLKKLNRFTSIPFLIDLLTRKKLTLLNPSFWEDYNDRATLELFRKRSEKPAIYALCLTYLNETVHHWNAFANGTSGCCIEFSPNKLFISLHNTGVIHDKAKYVFVKDLPSSTFQIEELPFLKRKPYKNENEYRLVILTDEEQKPAFDIDVNLDSIRRVTLSSKMPKEVFLSTKAALIKIAPEIKGKIYQSTLYSSVKWMQYFEDD